MSTPMRHGPSQQGRTPSQAPGPAPTPPVSTPFSTSQAHAAFSPGSGPRTSPQQVKKSPATSATLKALGDGAVNFDSPSAAAALGILGSHGNLDLNLDSLGMGGLAIGRTDEDERKKRFDAILDMLKAASKGKVSNEGLERLARSLNLECLWEDNAAGGPLAKTLIIAGNGLALEISITNHVVENLSVNFPDCSSSVQAHIPKVADILLRDLKLAPNQSPLTKTLEKFQYNLTRLAALDKLSQLPHLNCYDAIAGIYETLLKIHKWDTQKLREDLSMKGRSDDYVKVAALCMRHGCPLMHVRDRLGLSLDYWKERRRMASTTVEKSDIKTWGVLIECAPRSEDVYFPIRVSEHWISDAIEKPEDSLTHDELLSANRPILDWQEPPNTFLPPEEEPKPDMDTGPEPTIPPAPRVPEVMFMATFDPPVIVTHAVAADIYTRCAGSVPDSSVTFDVLFFPIPQGDIYDPSEPRKINRIQAVSNFATPPTPGEEEKHLRWHKNTLFIYKPVYGQILAKVPMQHPRQLVEMLPLLRQYAFLSTLLSKSFKPKGHPFPEYPGTKAKADTTITAKDEFKSFMSSSANGTNGSSNPTNGSHGANGATPPISLDVDITLTAHPVPRLQIVFPFKKRTANIMLEIQLGGKVHIVSENILTDEEGDQEMGDASASKGKTKYTPEQLVNMLEIAEDIGIWCEFIKMKLE